MGLSVEMVTVDCADPDALAQWWSQAVGGDVNVLAPGEFSVLVRPEGVRLGFQKVPDPTPGKNRLHLDLSAADVEAEVARLVGAGRGGDRTAQLRAGVQLGRAGRSRGQRVLHRGRRLVG